jgi:hypothetical protein
MKYYPLWYGQYVELANQIPDRRSGPYPPRGCLKVRPKLMDERTVYFETRCLLRAFGRF